MATSAAEIDFVPDEIDFVPDEASPTGEIDFIPDEVIAQEAQRATAGALQAVDVMRAPGQFDWSEVNEELDKQRFYESESLRAQAALGTGDPAALQQQAAQKREGITPFTTTGQRLAQQAAGEQQISADVATTAARPNTPASVLSSFMGPGLSANVQPVVEAAGQNIGGAVGGALGAAALIPGPVGGASRLSGFLATALPITGGVLGSLAGQGGQEAVLQVGETPEQTQARQQRAAQAFEENPIASRIGAAGSSGFFYGPSLAQFGRAVAGDKAAITNLGIAGAIGGAMEVGTAMAQGRTADARDIAAGVFSNLIMNEPTRLGRKLGLPSSEPKVVEVESGISIPEEISAPPKVPQTSEGDSLEGLFTVFSNRRDQLRSEGVSPSDPEFLALERQLASMQKSTEASPAAPEAPPATPEQSATPKLLGTAIRMPDGTPMQGNRPTQSHQELILLALERSDPDGTTGYMPKNEDLGFAVQNPDGSVVFVDRTQGAAIAKENGIIPPEAPDTLTSEILQEFAPKPAAEAPAPTPEVTAPTDEQRIAKLVEAGMTPEDAAAGLAKVKGAEAPSVESPSEEILTFEKIEQMSPEQRSSKWLRAYRGISKSKPFNDTDTAWWTTNKSVAEEYAREIMSYDDPSVIEAWINIKDIPRLNMRKASEAEIEATQPDQFGNPQKIGVYENSDDSQSGAPQTVIHAPKAAAVIKGQTSPVGHSTPPTAEAAPLDPNTTSNKEAVVNAERAARDLDPIIKEARISNADSIDRAQQVVEQNPLRPQEIIARLRENPQERTISLEDSAVLLVERTRLNAQRDALLDRATDPSLDPAEQIAARGEFDAVETRLNELDQAAQDARSTWGRFGQLWQRSMRRDFSLEPLLARARLKKGEPLSAEETAQIKSIADDSAAAQQTADVAVAKAEAAAVEKQVDNTIGEIAKKPDLDPAVRSLADRIIAKLDLQAQAARTRLRERFKKVGSAPDPLILADFTVLAANRVAKGTIKASQWAAEMIREFGEEVRPYLEQAWNAASAKLDEMVNAGTGDRKKRTTVKEKILDAGVQRERIITAIGARVKEGESLESLGNYIDRLVETFVRSGVRDRGALVASVKGVLEPMSPGITDRKVGELISGYGQATLLSKDPLKVIKRDLKGQLQQVSKLEALAAKEPLKKTGPERRTPSDEERRLTKEVNAAKKAAGVVTTDPETQLKSTMDAARTRIGNEIKDLTFEIETGVRPPEKTPIAYAADIEIMRGLRDRLRQTLRELEGPREITEEQRIAITTRGLQDSIAALESRIAGAQPKTKRAAPDTPAIRALKAKRDALRTELQEMESADALLQENRKAEALVRAIERAEDELAGPVSRPGRVQGPESEMVAEARQQLAAVREAVQAKRDADPTVQQERMDAAEAAVERAIKKLDEQLQAGDISVQRAPSRAGSQRLEDLRMQRDAMNHLRAQLRAEARPKPNPLDVAIKARKSALKRQEADYEARIAKGDFGPRTRKPPVDISGDAEAMDALARVQAVKDKFATLQKEWELKNLTRTQKVKRAIGQTWDALRNLKLSMDLSAPIQTAFAMASRPIEGAKALGVGARAAFDQFFKNSDTYAKRVQQQIVNSPNNKNGIYKDMKLELSLGDKREENAGSVLERLADLESRWQDIPDFVKGFVGLDGQKLIKGTKGIAKALPKILGLGIKASNASFNAVANHMRARTADAMLNRWYRNKGAPTKQQLELLGNFINAATGKGGLKGEKAITKVAFAPNYYLSIMKMLSLQPVRKSAEFHEGKVAVELLREYVRSAITVTTVGMLQHLFGDRDEQTLDPRDPNFARAKTDKGTSLDFTLGKGAYVTLGAQLITGETIDRKGRVKDQDRMRAFLNFLKGRLSREISTSLTTAAGKDWKGKPIDAAAVAKELVTPLSWQDVDDVLKREGLTRGTFIQMLNLLGVTHRLAD